MKLKTVIALLISVLCLNVYASRVHNFHSTHPATQKSQGLTAPRPCEIELVNQTFSPVNVHIAYDDGGEDWAILYANDPLYIDLYYAPGGYCQAGAGVYIETNTGRPIFNQYVLDGQTVTVDPYLLKQKNNLKKLK